MNRRAEYADESSRKCCPIVVMRDTLDDERCHRIVNRMLTRRGVSPPSWPAWFAGEAMNDGTLANRPRANPGERPLQRRASAAPRSLRRHAPFASRLKNCDTAGAIVVSTRRFPPDHRAGCCRSAPSTVPGARAKVPLCHPRVLVARPRQRKMSGAGSL
jgi:hypothetical protein